MKLLLDTHAFPWMSLDNPELSETARDVIAELENELLLSPSSFWEIGIKISIGKYELQEPLDVFVDREVQRNSPMGFLSKSEMIHRLSARVDGCRLPP